MKKLTEFKVNKIFKSQKIVFRFTVFGTLQLLRLCTDGGDADDDSGWVREKVVVYSEPRTVQTE
jgi:hypothetical protein